MDRLVSWEYEGRLVMTWTLSGFAVKEALERSLIFELLGRVSGVFSLLQVLLHHSWVQIPPGRLW
jgi:hypothetical protein